LWHFKIFQVFLPLPFPYHKYVDSRIVRAISDGPVVYWCLDCRFPKYYVLGRSLFFEAVLGRSLFFEATEWS